MVFATRNSQLFINPQLNTQVTSWMNAEYGFEQRWLLVRPDQAAKRLNTSSKHQLNVYVYLPGNTIISLTNSYYHFGSGDAYFSDMRFSRRLKPKGMELEIAANNLFNARTYVEFHTSSFTLFEYIYELRPAQALVTLRFGF